jgi:hypothetical protein
MEGMKTIFKDIYRLKEFGCSWGRDGIFCDPLRLCIRYVCEIAYIERGIVHNWSKRGVYVCTSWNKEFLELSAVS